MKRWILVMICVLLYAMPVNATELGTEDVGETVSAEETEEVVEESETGDNFTVEETEEPQEEDTVENNTENGFVPEEESTEASDSNDIIVVDPAVENNAVVTVEIPDVIGMTEAEAEEALKAVLLPDGTVPEIIKEKKYARGVENGIVYEQNPVGIVPFEEGFKVTISISMGTDPQETDTSAYVEPLNQTIISKFSQYGIDWESIPASYEYNWDNSENCWYNGVWIDGVCYKTQVDEYNTNVRHKVQLYRDEKNVYFHIVFSRDYEAKGNGSDYIFYLDRQGDDLRHDPMKVAFQAEISSDPNVQIPFNTLPPGTHQLYLTHRDSAMSYREVYGGEAYYTVFESDVNAHLEMMIPLEEMKAQNPNVDIENFGILEVWNPNLMYRTASYGGASTFPFATAAAALVLVPATALVINKRRKTVKKDSNE